MIYLNKYKLVLIGGLILLIYLLNLKHDFDEVDNNGIEKVGYVLSYNTRGSSGPYLIYAYYVDNVKYTNMIVAGGDVKQSHKEKYYIVKYLKEKPHKSILYLNNEIRDSLRIAKFKEQKLISRQMEIDEVRRKQLDRIKNN